MFTENGGGKNIKRLANQIAMIKIEYLDRIFFGDLRTECQNRVSLPQSFEVQMIPVRQVVTR